MLFFVSFSQAQASKIPSAEGAIDALTYERATHSLNINGWVWDRISAKPIARLRIVANGEEYIVHPIAILRPDVRQAKSISLMDTGFSATVALKSDLSAGEHAVEITALLDEGRTYALSSSGEQPVIHVLDSFGALDSITYDKSHQQLEVRGWVWDSVTDQPAKKIFLSIQDENHEARSIELLARKDVRDALSISNEKTGFSAHFSLNKNLSAGNYPIKLISVFQDGREFELKSGTGNNPFLQIDSPKNRHWIILFLVVFFIFSVCFFCRKGKPEKFIVWTSKKTKYLTIAGIVCFFALVSMGVTGSSWKLLEAYSGIDAVGFKGEKRHIFKQRPIRSDEWGVLTPNALAQVNHEPNFPIVNKNLGLEGQNMGVIGMTGVPIWQPAALGRIATWGYFLLPLKQAMSWHWLFPFFGCLFFLWKALARFNPSGIGVNFLLAISFCVAPYAAGWSLWPLYAAFFPLAIFVVLTSIFECKNFKKNILLGIFLGILLTGWVMTLYPPWQVTLGTLLAFIVIGWILDNRNNIKLSANQYFSLAFALLISCLLIGSWWLDTSQAVSQIRDTVYPGGRSALKGADILNAPWWALRGYYNPEALTFGLGAGVENLPKNVIANQSEISSYIIFPIPIFLLSLMLWKKASVGLWVLRACSAFVGFALIFGFFGVPLWLSKLTLWSYVTAARLDLSLALACTILLALIAANTQDKPKMNWVFASLTALSGSVLVILAFHLLPASMLRANSFPLQIAMVIAAAAASWWIVRGRIVASVAMTIMLSLISTFGFNPLSKAPESIEANLSKYPFIVSDNGQPLRTLVISDGAAPSMLLAAAGIPTVTGVLYYPHVSLWKEIGLSEQDWPIVNRYQHLSFRLDNSLSNDFKVGNSQGDTVIVSVNPSIFNFSKTTAKLVVARKNDAIYLNASSFLKEVGRDEHWVWFSVKKPSS
jgi:hypothetical protein